MMEKKKYGNMKNLSKKKGQVKLSNGAHNKGKKKSGKTPKHQKELRAP